MARRKVMREEGVVLKHFVSMTIYAWDAKRPSNQRETGLAGATRYTTKGSVAGVHKDYKATGRGVRDAGNQHNFIRSPETLVQLFSKHHLYGAWVNTNARKQQFAIVVTPHRQKLVTTVSLASSIGRACDS